MSVFWIGIFLAVLFVISLIVMEADSREFVVILSIIAIVIFAILISGYCNKDSDKPTAIDVYRGETTLQITYRDSIPVDSVVVFKTIKNK